MGGDTRYADALASVTAAFQSQVAILGWGYGIILKGPGAGLFVSIAGGDSWVGIRILMAATASGKDSFNRRWRFLGGDTNRW